MYSDEKRLTDASPRPLAFVLTDDVEGIARQYLLAESEQPGSALAMMAEALASSPLWKSLSPAVMVVRPSPRPALAILGYFDAAAEARIEALRLQLDSVLARLRYVDYKAAERDCEQLARRLIERFGREELARFSYAPIPKGGFIVLGMLSYVLGLRREQLEPANSPDAPLVVVDDCALTGLRFGEFLHDVGARRIVFAPLYSHPDLRTAIEAREPQVIACMSANDLHDHAPERLGGEYPDWRRRWAARSENRCYWVGQPDHVCFAWNEPDVTFWNSATEEDERGWRVVHPSYCLKNRHASRVDPQNRVQVQSVGGGPLKPSTNVLFGDLDGELIVADLKNETTLGFSGVAADIWHAVVAGGTRAAAHDALMNRYDIDGATLKSDLNSFIEDLLTRGLLQENEVDKSDC